MCSLVLYTVVVASCTIAVAVVRQAVSNIVNTEKGKVSMLWPAAWRLHPEALGPVTNNAPENSPRCRDQGGSGRCTVPWMHSSGAVELPDNNASHLRVTGQIQLYCTYTICTSVQTPLRVRR
jgi:hypothetical protein